MKFEKMSRIVMEMMLGKLNIMQFRHNNIENNIFSSCNNN